MKGSKEKTANPILETSVSKLLGVALPLSLGAFVQFLVLLTDNYFLAQVSESAINGAGISAMVYITASMVVYGLTSGTQIFIARKHGENDVEGILKYFGTGSKLALITGSFLFIALLVIANWILPYWLASQEVLSVAQSFLQIRAIGFMVYAMTLCLVAYYVGTTKTSTVMFATLITSLANIVLDYVLIFGHFGMPSLEANGAALATVIAEILGLGFLLLMTHRESKELLPSIFRGKLNDWKPMLLLSLPITVQQVSALATWTLFFFMVEKTGGLALKVSNIIRNFYMLAFVILMGIGQTTRTYVSGLIAEKRQSDIQPTLWKLIGINIAGVLLLCHGFLLYPEFIASFFFDDIDEGLSLVKSLRVIFFAVLLFSFGSVWINAIEGAGRTEKGMAIEFISIFVYLSLVYYLAIERLEEIHVIWMADYLYFGVLGGLAGLYLIFGKWKHHQI